MILTLHFRRVARDIRGAVIVEFALLAPVLIIAMLGVFYVAITLQSYNSLRSIASDTARRVMVEYQKDNSLSTDEIEAVARSIAVGPPYLLATDQLDISVAQETTSRVTDAVEMTISLGYQGENFLPIVSLNPSQMSYERPIFVVDEAAAEEEE